MNTASEPRALVLASTSAYRRQLLARLGLPFECVPPQIDEVIRPGEPPRSFVQRLAAEKAAAGARCRPDALVIGSDQIALRGDRILGKPGTHAAAVAQLQAASGHALQFLTAVCLLDARDGRTQTHVDDTVVRFRSLTLRDIERYLARDRPYDCAGSFKSEALGVVLFESVRTEDPSALLGLPLIWLCAALRAAGLPVI